MPDSPQDPAVGHEPAVRKNSLGSLLIGVLLVAAVVGAFIFFRPPSLAGDRAKLDAPLSAAQQQQADARTITMAEVEANDGLEGRPAWIAVNGIVFDVSESAGWEDGEHRGVRAGTDGTDLFVSSPHGYDFMARTPILGRLAG